MRDYIKKKPPVVWRFFETVGYDNKLTTLSFRQPGEMTIKIGPRIKTKEVWRSGHEAKEFIGDTKTSL
jgi:hypothetical protein